LNSYIPTDLSNAALSQLLLPVSLILGFYLSRISSVILARLLSWTVAGSAITAMHWYTLEQPPGFRMIAIIGITLFTMKTVIVCEVRHTKQIRLTLFQWIGFAVFWVGMRPALFADVPRSPRKDYTLFIRRGCRNILLGLSLIIVSRLTWDGRFVEDQFYRTLLVTILLLPGISLTLHFGFFNLLTAAWRYLGAEANMLFREPFKSLTLAEFWGKRWNLAFSEMTTLAIYRPLRAKWGTLPATLVAFLFSGLLHELAISVPVRSGYGLPLAYFALHGAAMLLETRIPWIATTLAKKPALGRIWTMSWILLPLPILFHQPFLQQVVWPIIGLDL